ncbi:hypothetical protein F5B20DRAFT_18530 [Whalleya microplaca]|nr:hypothetical protein F5B20DRAFT_18530 [Whalleya microplaca]
MAPVPFQHPVKFAPLAKTGTHIALIVYLTYAVTASLYTSYRNLRPAQDTRSRQAKRKRLVPIFVGLAIAALSLATYSSIATAILSYRTWAYEHGLDQPQRFLSEDGIITDSKNSSQQYIAQWLSDTPLVYDALEIVVEKSRRFWWGQQIDLATVSFSMLLAIEGRRRKIPLTPAFLALAHLVNLSYAQNLFYLALLLTPAPLPTGDELELPIVPFPTSRWIRVRDWLMPPKPDDWHPYPFIFLSTLVLNYGYLFLLPYAANTSSFANVVLATRAVTFLPLILPKIAPVNGGTVHSHPHDAYSSYKTLFRIISVASILLHLKATIVGLISTTPNAHYHRHSVFLPWDVESRTKWERGTTALVKLLGSISEHPAVAGVGWDVLLSAFSLGLWAAVRAPDAHDILASVVPFYSPHSHWSTDQPTTADPSIPHRARKPDPGPGPEAIVEDPSTSSEHSMTLRRRARPAKTPAAAARGASVASSMSATTTSEDHVTATPGRKRGRPRKTAKQPEEERAYEPPPRVEAREGEEADVVPEDLDWETAALVWGLVTLGGLGVAGAGVVGAECVAR